MSLGIRRIGVTSAVASTILASAAMTVPAHAASFDFTLPAGVACPDFSLRVVSVDSKNRVFREFFDREGNLVRTFSGGKGADLTLTNVDNGKFIEVKANGSVIRETFNTDGSTTVENSGHFGVILFPTDVPLPGEDVPSSILYTGRVVYTVDADGIFVMQSASGRSRDICAELR